MEGNGAALKIEFYAREARTRQRRAANVTGPCHMKNDDKISTQ